MIEKFSELIKDGLRIKKSYYFFVISLLILSALTIPNQYLSALTAQQWEIIDFTEHGTRRLIEIEGNRWFFYRPEANRELSLETEGGKIRIMSAARDDSSELTYQLRVNNAFRNFRVRQTDTIEPFNIMEDVYLNLGPGTHELRIACTNRLAYFKVFREDEVWTVPTVRQAFIPDKYIWEFALASADSENPYYSANNTSPLEFEVTGPNDVDGFARFLADNNEEEARFDIYVNAQRIDTITIPHRFTGSYYLKEKPDQKLSIGRRIDFSVPPGEHRVRIVPHVGNTFIFRLFKEIPEDIPVKTETVYEVEQFRKPSFAQKTLSGLDLTAGFTFRYSDNVFSLSEYDRDRFEKGELTFIDTADDFIINPYLRIRYPITLGDYTLTPYLNANYYYYMNNDEKSNYSILSGLFNSYGNFNLNLYYGYYADLYVRDYRAVTNSYENFAYEKNLYRLYSYFRLGRFDTPLLYFQIEEYFHNEFFTDYDGTAYTYGLGWRRSFPTFYLRLFYYYREFQAANTDYVLADITGNERITDPQYESNIYDLQFRNKLVDLNDNNQIRPYFGFRFENRFFTTRLPVISAPYQSTRNDKRYRFNFGCEFYLIKDFVITLDYNYFLRDSFSEHDPVSKFKDYSQQSISIDFEYRMSF